MTKSQAFWKGFCSVLDFSRPFSEKAEIRSREEMKAEYEQLRKKLRLGENPWIRVGENLRKAMSQYESEVGIDKIESSK